jgi:ADP-heptose:LPS heptosyltransferase
MQMIPLYLNLKKKFLMDVADLKQYPTDTSRKADCFPATVREINKRQYETQVEKNYDYIFKPPFVYERSCKPKKEPEALPNTDLVPITNESDSEYERNMKILQLYDVEPEFKMDVIKEDSEFEGQIVVHNGALEGWERKLYPHFPALVKTLTKKYKVTSIGSPNEYVEGTQDATGTSLRKTAGTIDNHRLYIGTDTGTYHLAAALKKNGIVLFTATDPNKNWDKTFHKTMRKLHHRAPCQPCQWGYHYSLEWNECKHYGCQNIPTKWVEEGVDLIFKGVI